MNEATSTRIVIAVVAVGGLFVAGVIGAVLVDTMRSSEPQRHPTANQLVR